MGSDKRVTEGRGVWNIVVYLAQFYIVAFTATTVAAIVTLNILFVIPLGGGVLGVIVAIIIAHLMGVSLSTAVVISTVLRVMLLDHKEIMLVWRGERKFFSELAEFCRDIVGLFRGKEQKHRTSP